MDALDLLLNRVSVTRLCEPAPDATQLDLLFRAALRAPDHGQLHPWRFLTIEGNARHKLGELFAAALQSRNPAVSDEALQKARNMPLRAPMLVVVVASLKVHPKVPEGEQLLAAGCAAHGMLLAAHAQGIGAVWRTGEFAYDSHVLEGLGLSEQERLLGFFYLGTPEGRVRTAPVLEPQAFVSGWDGQTDA
ncbi:NAD(P)H nitroreductase [Stutzerimonas decontaminans]|jgi:nitroreductase|uniref:Putative NAD(P)H nitroreductase n=2 Tax=Stutzerimonas TaxID=2901164 RepID=A0ABX4W688_9GAMM|nr:NAD(P)H nitroreductase [Stutzerimonas decontaminans]AHY42602.1 nitroreductase [Stutzerimonas decontaminans]MCQ4246421.1 NAD(P)H nitroreductase [Stutzerimonas decontaminans]PNF86870.1 NAD(P)H nitroreductase [Stutzerimonas decontaminans]